MTPPTIEALLADAINEAMRPYRNWTVKEAAQACLRTLAEHGYRIVGPEDVGKDGLTDHQREQGAAWHSGYMDGRRTVPPVEEGDIEAAINAASERLPWKPCKHHRDFARDAVRAALAECEAWQPIETAPKDGKSFLAAIDGLVGGAPEVVSYEADNPEFCWGGDGGNFHRLRFTHWCSLPLGPGDIAAAPANCTTGLKGRGDGPSPGLIAL